MAGQGAARPGKARPGEARQARLGLARQDQARRGSARQGMARQAKNEEYKQQRLFMPNKIQTKFIVDALDSDHLLSEWEIEFINNLAEYPEDRPLTDKQNEILNRISQKINRGE